ncbi:MAG TPA: hypothetical protein VEX13_05770 [Chloroflexia bacterium]|nr:hypothetical protein [Chloroflexia bacterium]
MRLDLETEIRYPTGERAGILRKVILGENNEVSEVVMATSDLISRNVVVPVDMLAEDVGGVLTINAGPDEVAGFDDYTEERVPAVTEEWEFSEDPAMGGEVFPATMYQPIMPVVEMSNIPEGAISLSQGTEVDCLDGRWGIVDEVLVDDDGQAYAFIGRPDALDEHDRVVPIALVQEASPESVVLNCTIADLPTYTQEIVVEQEEPEIE